MNTEMQSWSSPVESAAQRLTSPGSVGAGAGDEVARLARGLMSELLQNPDDVHERSLAVRAALRAVCEQARARDMPAERVLLVLKAAWRELPAPGRRSSDNNVAALGRVISICIEEYFEPGRRG